VSGSDKTEQPTAKRRREARRKGQIARTPDLVAWTQVLAAGLLLQGSIAIAGGRMRSFFHELEVSFNEADPGVAMRLLGVGLRDTAFILMPLLVGMVGIGIIGHLAQTKGAMTPGGMKPKWERVNPGKGLKRLFSPASAWEGGKAALKVAVLTLVAWPVMVSAAEQLGSADQPHALEMVTMIGSATARLIRNTALAGLVLAAIDFAYQRKRVKKMTMMTKQEVKEEYRQSEGDPMLKGRIRQRQVEMSRNRMMSDVADASVVVVNPTHIAVALRYDPTRGAPRVVASGAGHVAARIREEAEKHGVPIMRDVPLARTLHKVAKVGQEIPADLYEAVARLLAFVFALRR
jgi:flagellar biosynthetic protein FlhB